MQIELAQRIKDAFSRVTYPGDENIGDLYLKDFIGQKQWNQVPIEILLRNETGIILFSPEAFHFFLPAFLSALLVDPKAERMIDSVISSLTPSSSPDRKALVEYAIKLFSNVEKSAVLEFLQRHQEFFPRSEFVLFEEDRLTLQRTIEFWMKNQ